MERESEPKKLGRVGASEGTCEGGGADACEGACADAGKAGDEPL